MHAYTVDSDERDSVSVVFLRSPMPLFSGRPSAIGAPSVTVLAVDSECCSVGK